MKDLKQKTVRAASWVIVIKFLSQAISFIIGIVLARLLIPDDFGLIAMAAFFIGVAWLMVDVGFGQALIQKQDVTIVHYSSIFWVNFLLSITLGLTLFLLAKNIANFYEREELTLILQVLSISYLLASFGFIPRMILTKNLEFKKISISELGSMIVSGTIAIAAAYKGYGYWSLVVHIVGQRLFASLFLWISHRWLPKILIDFQAIRELFGFSIYVFLTRLLQYAAGSIDKLLLGKYIDSHSTGIYDKAQSIILTPLGAISDSIGAVMFPSLSLIQNDVKRIRNVYIRTTRAIALITFPMMTGMFVVSDAFVISILGEQWLEIIPVIKIFCIAGMFSSLATVVPAIYQSQGKTGLQFKVNLITQPLRIVAVVIGLYWGIYGVVIGYVLAVLMTKTITITVAGRLIDVKLVHHLRMLLSELFSSILMALIVLLSSVFLQFDNYAVLLLSQIIIGIFSYWLLLILLKNSAYNDLLNVFKEQITKKTI